jgi:hypothetical protein
VNSETELFLITKSFIPTHNSSKSVNSVFKFITTLITVKTDPKQIYNCLLVGASIGTLQRSVLNIMTGILNHYFPQIKYSYNRQFNYITILNYKIYLIGFSNITTSKIILGPILLFVYIDKVNLAVKEGFEVILDRMSLKESKLIASMNPTNPSHWIYEEFIDREELKDILTQLAFLIN